MQTQKNGSDTFTIRVGTGTKRRLERLADSMGRSRSFLAAEALVEYLDVNEWQIRGIKEAIASMDRGEGISHAKVRAWVESLGSRHERKRP